MPAYLNALAYKLLLSEDSKDKLRTILRQRPAIISLAKLIGKIGFFCVNGSGGVGVVECGRVGSVEKWDGGWGGWW
jgi:hypothetical protein